MGTTLSPLSRWVITLRKLLLRLLNPAFVSRIFDRIFRRVVLWITLVRSKLYPTGKGFNEPRKDDVTTSNGTPAKSLKQQDLTYTITRNGEIVPLNEAAFSLYPFSANGIRSSRSSVRSRQSQTRDASITRSSRHTPSINDYPPSHYSRHTPSINDYPPSVYGSDIGIERVPANQDRIHRHLRNPRRQFSISLPDLQHGQERPRLPPINSNVQWSPAPHNPTLQSPSPAVDVISPSPTEARSPPNDGKVDVRRWDEGFTSSPHNWNAANRAESPTPGIKVEPMSPVEEVGSPREYDETSFRVPSPSPSSAGRSSPASHHSDSNNHKSVTRFSRDIVDLPSESDISHIYPAMAEVTRRYERRAMIRNQYCYLVVPPVTTVYRKSSVPAGWIKYVHPEGAPYYHNPEKNIYTDSDINDPAIYRRLMEDVFKLEQTNGSLERSLPEGRILMIDVAYKRKDENYDGSVMFVTEYYYVDPIERVIFWVHEYNSQFMDASWDIKGPKSFQHLGHEITAQFWFFISLYPSALCLTVEMVRELRDLVLYFIGDHATSPFSTAPYTMEVLFQILSLTENMEKNIGQNHLGTISLFARHMYIFGHSRFNNCFGESFARVERNFSIFGDHIFKRTWLVKSLSPILFSAPDVHLRNLQNMWVDGLMHKTVWEESIKKLNDEWQEFVFFATVMLTSNVGVLAIQSVDINMDPTRSPTQIASYISVVMNTGSIILGLLLMRQNRTKNRETSDDVQNFLRQRNHPMLGLETLAILYSLPYALLMWGVVAFLVSFCCIFFQNSTNQTRGLVGSLSAAVAALIIWCIATSWEGRMEQDDSDRLLEQPEAVFLEEECVPPPKLKDTILDAITRYIPHVNIPHINIPIKFMNPKMSTDSENTAV